MIVIKNVRTIDGINIQCSIESQEERIIDAEDRLTLFPALIDSHNNKSENYKEKSQAAIQGGVTTLFFSLEQSSPSDLYFFKTEKDFIDKQLQENGCPIEYFFYLESSENAIHQISTMRDSVLGIKIEEIEEDTYDSLFRIAAQLDIILAMDLREKNHANRKLPRRLMKKAITYAEKYNASLYFLNVHSEEEIELIEKVKHQGIMVYAETTPSYLHFSENSLLWDAIEKGSIDAIGNQAEILLPFLLNAHWEKKISFEKIVEITRKNIQMMFQLSPKEDIVLVDLNKEQFISNSFINKKLKGWPVLTIVKGKIFSL